MHCNAIVGGNGAHQIRNFRAIFFLAVERYDDAAARKFDAASRCESRERFCCNPCTHIASQNALQCPRCEVAAPLECIPVAGFIRRASDWHGGRIGIADNIAPKFTAAQWRVLQSKCRRQCERRNVVEGRILELIDRLENAANQAVLRLHGRDDQRIGCFVCLSIYDDIASQFVCFDAMEIKQIGEQVHACRIARRREYPRLGFMTCCVFDRRVVELFLIAQVVQPQLRPCLDARDACSEVFANIFAIGAKSIGRFKLTSKCRSRLE